MLILNLFKIAYGGKGAYNKQFIKLFWPCTLPPHYAFCLSPLFINGMCLANPWSDNKYSYLLFLLHSLKNVIKFDIIQRITDKFLFSNIHLHKDLCHIQPVPSQPDQYSLLA